MALDSSPLRGRLRLVARLTFLVSPMLALAPGCPRSGADDAPPLVGEASPGEGGDPGAAASGAGAESSPATTDGPGEADPICVEGIVVSWKGAVDAPPEVERTQGEARLKVDELYARLEEEGRSFASVARESDRGVAGLMLGVFREDDWPDKHRPLLPAVRELNVQMFAPVVETAYGYVIPRRCRIGRTRFRRLTIAYRGAVGAGPGVDIDREEAARQAEAVAKILKGDPKLFPQMLAVHGSDADDRKASGGDLGVFVIGDLPDAIRSAGGGEIRELETTPPYDEPEGFVLYQRLPPDYQVPPPELPPRLPVQGRRDKASPGGDAPSAGD